MENSAGWGFCRWNIVSFLNAMKQFSKCHFSHTTVLFSVSLKLIFPFSKLTQYLCWLWWRQVHYLMCMKLFQFITRVSVLLPEIEAARPGCSSGREALCRLNIEIDIAKTLCQRCTESSKLYLVCILEQAKPTSFVLSVCVKFIFQISLH